MEVEVNVATVPSVPPPSSRNLCVRAGCTKPAVENKDWDFEYCSNECVATHCRCVCTTCKSVIVMFANDPILLNGSLVRTKGTESYLVRADLF